MALTFRVSGASVVFPAPVPHPDTRRALDPAPGGWVELPLPLPIAPSLSVLVPRTLGALGLKAQAPLCLNNKCLGGGVQLPKSCLTLCDPMDGSTPGLAVLHHLPGFAQIHVC